MGSKPTKIVRGTCLSASVSEKKVLNVPSSPSMILSLTGTPSMRNANPFLEQMKTTRQSTTLARLQEATGADVAPHVSHRPRVNRKTQQQRVRHRVARYTKMTSSFSSLTATMCFSTLPSNAIKTRCTREPKSMTLQSGSFPSLTNHCAPLLRPSRLQNTPASAELRRQQSQSPPCGSLKHPVEPTPTLCLRSSNKTAHHHQTEWRTADLNTDLMSHELALPGKTRSPFLETYRIHHSSSICSAAIPIASLLPSTRFSISILLGCPPPPSIRLLSSCSNVDFTNLEIRRLNLA